MKYLSVLIFLFLLSCQSTSKQELELKNIDIYTPKDINFREGMAMNQEMQNEFDFFNYIYGKYLFTISTQNYHTENLYNSRMFYDGGSEFVLKETYQYQDDKPQIETYDKYYFNKTGELTSVKSLSSSNYTMEFYYQNNRISKIINHEMSIPMTQTIGHSVTEFPSESATHEILFNYSQDNLISQIFNQNSFSSVYRYYSSGNSDSKSFVKFIDKDYTPAFKQFNDVEKEYLFCFENNKIQYMTESFKASKEAAMSLIRVYVFEYNYNTITIKAYNEMVHQNNKSDKEVTKYNLYSIYEMQISNDSFRLERIKQTHFVNKIDYNRTSISDYYYEYHYTESKLTGYSIFEDRYILTEENKDRKSDYKLKNAFQLTSN